MGLVVAIRKSLQQNPQLPDSLLLSSTLSLHARRALRELLTNAARHAAATTVWVQLRHVNHYLAIKVADDGVGFDVDTAVRPGHYGIIGLQERARLTGGQFSIESTPGDGTTVQLLLPLESNA